MISKTKLNLETISFFMRPPSCELYSKFRYKMWIKAQHLQTQGLVNLHLCKRHSWRQLPKYQKSCITHQKIKELILNYNHDNGCFKERKNYE